MDFIENCFYIKFPFSVPFFEYCRKLLTFDLYNTPKIFNFLYQNPPSKVLNYWNIISTSSHTHTHKTHIIVKSLHLSLHSKSKNITILCSVYVFHKGTIIFLCRWYIKIILRFYTDWASAMYRCHDSQYGFKTICHAIWTFWENVWLDKILLMNKWLPIL